MLALLLACAAPSDSAAPGFTEVPWSTQAPWLQESSATGRAWRRAIIHLHSPLSHDACDNHEGDLSDEQCLADQRAALCADAVDVAFMTDHPAYAAEQTYTGMLNQQAGDQTVDGVANRIDCGDGRGTLVLPGIEDELMPIGLDRQVSDDAVEADAIYNATDQATFDAEIAAGALVMQAHTEGKTLDDLLARQQMGLTGTEMFNLHAMVDPTKREEDLGLDAFGYLDAIGPFINASTEAEPDLGFLGFYEEQTVSIERWDALNQVALAVGTAGTDAHENTLPVPMADGERVDSYRRMMRWFSNVLLVDGDGPEDAEAAVAAGRLFVAFDTLGVPSGFDVRYEVGDTVLEMGGQAEGGGRLIVGCPTLAASSPQTVEPPEITVEVKKDGATWQTGCGTWTVDTPGVYRVEVDILPLHLAGFLDDQQSLVHTYPWLYSNALRIGL